MERNEEGGREAVHQRGKCMQNPPLKCAFKSAPLNKEHLFCFVDSTIIYFFTQLKNLIEQYFFSVRHGAQTGRAAKRERNEGKVGKGGEGGGRAKRVGKCH